MAGKSNVQDYVLEQLKTNGSPVQIILTSGVRITGTIQGFDTFVLIVDVGNKQETFFKHMVSTVIPSKPIRLNPQ